MLKFQDLLDIYAEWQVVKEFATLIFKGQGVAAATQYSHLDDLNP